MLTVDAHIDTPWIMAKQGAFDLQQRSLGTVDFPRMGLGGLQAAIFALYLSESLQDSLGPWESSCAIDDQYNWLHFQPGCGLVRTPQEAFEELAVGNMPIFLGLEGGRLLQDTVEDPESMTRLVDLAEILGIRYLTLTHNRNTAWADSSTDLPQHHGLTRFGKDVVRECERLGVLVDLSHASDQTCWAAIGELSGPVIASHSGCRALLNHPRNLSDQLIKAIAKGGGVVHIPFAKRFIGPSMSGVADHIDHVVQLVGNSSHVGIGSDLDGAVLADGVEDVSSWSRVCVEPLERRGYSPTDVHAIIGGNTLRILG